MLAFVVIDTRAVRGLTVQQLADATAVLGLSMIDTRRAQSLSHASALQLLRDPASRGRITGLRFDGTYLHALYSGDAGLTSGQRTALMAQEIVRTGQGRGAPAKSPVQPPERDENW
ncbi:MAG TPA: hypothetical protein VGC56_10755 [Allosphingosinicella sp.]|jgi:hypothetical protein